MKYTNFFSRSLVLSSLFFMIGNSYADEALNKTAVNVYCSNGNKNQDLSLYDTSKPMSFIVDHFLGWEIPYYQKVSVVGTWKTKMIEQERALIYFEPIGGKNFIVQLKKSCEKSYGTKYQYISPDNNSPFFNNYYYFGYQDKNGEEQLVGYTKFNFPNMTGHPWQIRN